MQYAQQGASPWLVVHSETGDATIVVIFGMLPLSGLLDDGSVCSVIVNRVAAKRLVGHIERYGVLKPCVQGQNGPNVDGERGRSLVVETGPWLLHCSALDAVIHAR